jgi:hypothetical protein
MVPTAGRFCARGTFLRRRIHARKALWQRRGDFFMTDLREKVAKCPSGVRGFLVQRRTAGWPVKTSQSSLSNGRGGSTG